MCQTHHRQLMITGTVKPIRPYRKRNAGTVKFSGLRLSPLCARTVDAYAAEREISRGAAIAEILETSLVTNKPKDGGEFVTNKPKDGGEFVTNKPKDGGES
jgi:hypothetical protein